MGLLIGIHGNAPGSPGSLVVGCGAVTGGSSGTSGNESGGTDDGTYIEFSVETLRFTREGGSGTIGVTSNDSWTLDTE